jgi:hypothetical protein
VALFSDRRDVPAQRDEDLDGRIDERDDRIATDRRDAALPDGDQTGTDRADDATEVTPEPARESQRSSIREQFDEREEANRQRDDVAATTVPADRYATDGEFDRAQADADRPVVVEGRRPRASLLATLSLITGVVAALAVLTGVLAGPGVALGIVAALLALGGVGATARRHVAGKSDALFGLVLGTAAVVVGVLALTGSLPWLNAETNYVTSLHDWLQAQMPWLFPG